MRFPRDARGSFLFVFGLALALRALVLAELSGTLLTGTLVGDAELYDHWARELAAGRGLDEPVLFQSPLYPFLLGALYRVAGPHPTAMLVVQALVGAAACGLVTVGTRRLFGAGAGLFAGLFLACYAPCIWYDALLHKTSLALGLGAGLVLVATSPRRGLREASALGVMLGLLALLRPNALALAPVLVVWILATSMGARAVRVLSFAAFLALPLVVLGLRNQSRGAAFVPVAANAGVNFYQGNGAGADGLYRPLVRGRAHPAFEREDARALAEADVGRPLGAREVNRYWFGRTVSDIRADTSAWLRLLARKLRLTYHADEVMDALALEAYREHSRVLDATARIAWFGTLAPLAALGLWSTRRHLRASWFLHASLVALTLSIVLFLVVGRLRAGLVTFLVPFAGAGAVELFRRIFRAPGAGSPIPAVLAFALVAIAVSLPTPVPGDPAATTYANLSSAFLRASRPDEAADAGRIAIARDESSGEGHFNLGVALVEVGDLEGASEHLERAAALEPELAADALERIGLARARSGEYAAAEGLFRRALALDPRRAAVHFNLGLTQRHMGRNEEAAASYLRALELDPNHTSAHHNLGILLEARGHFVEAVRHYRAALAAEPDFLPSLLRNAWVSAVCSDSGAHDAAEAVRSAERATRQTDLDCEVADTLAAAYAAAGRFAEALAVLDRAPTDARTAAILQTRRTRYAAGERLREEADGSLPATCIP